MGFSGRPPVLDGRRSHDGGRGGSAALPDVPFSGWRAASLAAIVVWSPAPHHPALPPPIPLSASAPCAARGGVMVGEGEGMEVGGAEGPLPVPPLACLIYQRGGCPFSSAGVCVCGSGGCQPRDTHALHSAHTHAIRRAHPPNRPW